MSAARQGYVRPANDDGTRREKVCPMSSSKNHNATSGASTTRALRAPKKRTKLATALRHSAPLAIATDGTVFLNVNVLDAIDHADLAGRRLFIGAALSKAEAE